MIILGIDPGIGRMGWGVIEKVHSSQFIVHGYGCVETDVKQDSQERLLAIYDQTVQIMKKYRPEALAIEDLFFNKNVKTAFAVGQARGVVLLAAVQNDISVTVYTPPQVKSAVAGYGKADKVQIGQMVKLTLHLKEIPKPDDTADALAIALTHAFMKKYK